MENMQELIASTRGFIRVERATGIADRTPLPGFLYGLMPESLVNLEWTDPALGVGPYAWLPPVDETPGFDPDTHERGAEETLVPDMETNTVKIIGAVVPRSPEAVQATMNAIDIELATRVDDLIASVTAKPMRFLVEYQEREAQARDFIARNGAGEVPARIAGFATASGMEPMAAAMLTVQQADNLRAAQGQLADLRMRKYEIKRAATREAKQAVFEDISTKAEAIRKAIG